MSLAESMPRARTIEPLWLEWLAFGGVLAFATWLLGMRGVWALLLHADPTGLTLVIIALFAGSTLWCGARSRELQRQRRWVDGSAGRASSRGVPHRSPSHTRGWGADYLQAVTHREADAATALGLLLERTHGPHG